MSIALLLLNGTLIAGLYALGRVATGEGVSPLGLLCWQAASSALLVGGLAGARRERLPLSLAHLKYYAVAGLLGMSLPYLATYWALAHLPAGIVGIVGSLSALFTYAISRAVGAEPASCIRLVGIAVALAGVLAILLPKGALPEPGLLPWVLVAAAAPLALAAGNVYRTRAWPPGLSPVAAAAGMLAVQALALAPIAVAAEAVVVPQVPLDAADGALLALAAIASGVYVVSFALQRRAGPVMVSQMGYVITVATLLIGLTVFGERYSAWVWLAVALVFAGVYLVTRRPRFAACSN